jgi:4-amino-4-deoxy-L-arabinose transferase-like glycosyltransferase
MRAVLHYHERRMPLREVPTPRPVPPSTIAIALLVAAVLSFGLGSAPLMDPDEGRNAEVAREMAATGDWAVPHLNGLPYLDKPVLFFAAAAACIRTFGANAAAARLPSLLFALALAAFTWWAARRLWGHPAAEVGALAAASSPLAVGFSRAVIFDSALAFFVSCATFCFLLAVEGETSTAARRWAAISWLAMGLGVLTKGPVAVVLPLLVAVPFALWRRAARRLFPAIGPVLLVAVVAPWIVAMSLRVPGFLTYALVTETMARVTTPQLNRTAPFWYFLPIVFAGTLPWGLALPAAVRSRIVLRDGRRALDPRTVFLLLWLVLPLVFFSLSQSKRSQYVLPLVVPVALLVAAGVGAGRLPAVRALAAAEGATGALLLAAGTLPVVVGRLEPQLRLAVPGSMRAVAASLVVGCIGALVIARWRPRAVVSSAMLLAVPMLAMPTIGHPLVAAIAEARSSLAIVAALPGPPEAFHLVSVGAYSPSLSFYMRQNTVMFTDDGEPLRSNYWFRNFSPAVYGRAPQFRPLAEWPGELERCPAGSVFVTRADRPDYRSALAARLPLLRENVRIAAYGPCPAFTPAGGP